MFLQYFEDWINSIEQRDGNFSKRENNKMFISQQTYEGLKISVNSIIEAEQFLLQHQVRCVLTERFCQDPLENHFGRQRSLGVQKDNPSLRDFRYNDSSIRNQKIFKLIAGNVQSNVNIEFYNKPNPCRKKNKTQ